MYVYMYIYIYIYMQVVPRGPKYDSEFLASKSRLWNPKYENLECENGRTPGFTQQASAKPGLDSSGFLFQRGE